MKEPLVLDTNVLLSAAIADSATRTLLVELEHDLVAPAALEEELSEYRELILERSSLTDAELDRLLDTLFKDIDAVPDDQIRSEREPAVDALGDVDRDDAVFLATALVVDGAIWSDDRDFHEQNLVPVYPTEAIIEEADIT